MGIFKLPYFAQWENLESFSSFTISYFFSVGSSLIFYYQREDTAIRVSYLPTTGLLWRPNREVMWKHCTNIWLSAVNVCTWLRNVRINKLGSCAEEIHRLSVARERKPSVTTWRHHSTPAATVSGLRLKQRSVLWGRGSVCFVLVGCRFGVAVGSMSHLGEAECWFVGVRSVMLQDRGKREGRRC